MNIKFNKLVIDGFMSFDKDTIEFDDLGVVLVTGENKFEEFAASNGSGKSAIFDSILWVLTGYTSRGSSNIVNKYRDGGALVQIDFVLDSVNYEITRTEDHPTLGKSLTIIANGEDISGSTYTKTKDILSDILSDVNYDILTSIIILSQGLPGRLSSLKPSGRKSRLEELSGMDKFVTEIQNKVNSVYTKLNFKYSELSNSKISIESSISSDKSNIDSCKSKIEFIKSQSENLISEEVYNKHTSELRDIQSKLESLNSEYQVCSDKISSCKLSVNSLNNTISTKNSEVQRYTSEFMSLSGSKCPYCGKIMDDISELDNKKSELIKLSSDAKVVLSNSYSQLEVVNSELSNYSKRLQEISSERMTLSERSTLLSKLVYDYENYDKSTSGLVEVIDSCSSRISDNEHKLLSIESELTEVNNELSIASFFKNSISKKLRSFLLEGVIKYMNTKLEVYSKYLFKSQGVITLECNGNNIDIRIGDNYFEDLSGGEGRRVDLALQLAQRDLCRSESGFSCNLLVLDEILDYLDSKGIYSVMELISEKSNDVDSLLVVTHKTDVSVPCDTTMTVVKGEDRLSRIRR